MKTITIHDNATINANGNCEHGNCKPVVCLDDFKVYTSVTDAAEAAGVLKNTMSRYLCQSERETIRGHKYCFLSNIAENLNYLSENMQAMYEKARRWDEHEARNREATEREERRQQLRQQIEAEEERMRQDAARHEERLTRARMELNALEEDVA